MKANLVIKKSDEMPMAIVDADVQSVDKFLASVNVETIGKQYLNELVNLGVGIVFCQKHIHLCIPRKIITNVEFV